MSSSLNKTNRWQHFNHHSKEVTWGKEKVVVSEGLSLMSREFQRNLVTSHSFLACIITCQVLKWIRNFLGSRKASSAPGKAAEQISISMAALWGWWEGSGQFQEVYLPDRGGLWPNWRNPSLLKEWMLPKATWEFFTMS